MISIEYYITSNDVFIIISYEAKNYSTTGFAENSSTKSGHIIYYECLFVGRYIIFLFSSVTIYASTDTFILVPYAYGHY